MLAIEEDLHRCLALTVAIEMRSGAIVGINSIIDIMLQLIDAAVQLLAKGGLIKLVQHHAIAASRSNSSCATKLGQQLKDNASGLTRSPNK